MATIYEESELTLPMLIGSNNRSLVRCLTESRAIAYQLVRSSRERDSPTRDVQTRSFSVEKCSDTDKEREREKNERSSFRDAELMHQSDEQIEMLEMELFS